MPLSAEQIYNDLNGQEVKEILVQRLAQILDQIPYLQRHLTLPRVRMTMHIQLEVDGVPEHHRTRDINDQFTVKLANPPLEYDTVDYVGQAEVDTYANPPDQIRDEFQLPIMTPKRDKMVGVHQDQPIITPIAPTPHPPDAVVVTGPPVVTEGGRREIRVVQDRGGPVVTGNLEYLSQVGRGKNWQNDPKLAREKGAPDVGINPGFKEAIKGARDK